MHSDYLFRRSSPTLLPSDKWLAAKQTLQDVLKRNRVSWRSNEGSLVLVRK